MEKVERRLMEPVSDLGMEKSKQVFNRFFHRISSKLQLFLLHKGLVYVLIGFLLGRAIILSEILPFALPFFGAVLLMKRDKALLAGLSLIAGGATVSLGVASVIAASIVAFLVLNRLSAYVFKDKLKILPFIILGTVAITRVGHLFLIKSSLSIYDYMMVGVEAGLSFILTLIFLQSIPLISARKYKQSLKVEEIICIMILLASVMTGLVGVSYQNLQAEHIFSRYIVLLFAFIGGSSIGSTVGVVTGLILSLANVGNLYHMSLLAFSGLLGGLLREGQKLGTAIGLLIGSVLISLYGQGSADIMTTLLESMIAILLFLLTPKAITSRLAKHIPGTNEHAQEQQQYVRKIRDVTAHRVDQFSQVFQALSESFATFYNNNDTDDEERETDLFLSSITENTCQHCFKKEKCWVENFDKTYDYMETIMHETKQNTYQTNLKLKKEFARHCSKANKVEEVIEEELNYFQANQKLKKEVQESRRLVAEQLLGVSHVMEDLSKEIKRERENHFVQEEQILDALQNFGIEIVNVDIYNLEQGNVDIEMSIPFCNGHGECEKIIAPMLSDILEESIIVKHEECANYPNGYCHVSFGSAKKISD